MKCILQKQIEVFGTIFGFCEMYLVKNAFFFNVDSYFVFYFYFLFPIKKKFSPSSFLIFFSVLLFSFLFLSTISSLEPLSLSLSPMVVAHNEGNEHVMHNFCRFLRGWIQEFHSGWAPFVF